MSVSRSFDTKYVMKTFLRFPRILPAFSTNHGKFQLSWCISTSSGMVGTNFDSMKECLSELHKRHDTVDIALPNLIYSLYITIWKRVLCQVTVTKLHSIQSVKQLWQSWLQPYIQVKFLFKKSQCAHWKLCYYSPSHHQILVRNLLILTSNFIYRCQVHFIILCQKREHLKCSFFFISFYHFQSLTHMPKHVIEFFCNGMELLHWHPIHPHSLFTLY